MEQEITPKEAAMLKYAAWRSIVLILACAFVITFVFAKTLPSYSTMQPRMRVSRSASLTLSTSWQKVDFSGTSTFNVNTFQLDPTGSGNPLVYWDATNKIFKFYNTTDVNYIMYFTGGASATLLTTPVSLKYRVTIPNGAGAGVPIYFPNPDADQCSDLGPVSYVAHRTFDQALPIYINQAIRTNGFYIEVQLSNGTLGTVTLDNAALLIQTSSTQN